VSRRDQVAEFHRLLGQPILDKPQVPPPDRVNLRLRLLTEEVEELLDACGYVGAAMLMRSVRDELTRFAYDTHVDIIGVADALEDIDFVVEGTRLEFGIDGEPLAAEVSRSNNAKAGGIKSIDGKVQKPEGWTPPDIEGELRKQGWEP
jgi:predicted HAD superfamily Cof-like phosphohydrolase